MHRLAPDRLDVVVEEGPLRRDALGVGVLVLDDADLLRVVRVPEARDPAALGPEDHALGGRGAVDLVLGGAEELADELALGHAHRLEDVAREPAVHADDSWRQGELGRLAGDQVQVGGLLRVLGHGLEEPGVVDRVVVVVARVDVQALLRHGAAADVEDVRESLARRRVERLVHVGDALAAREVHRAEAHHGHAGRDSGGRVLALGLDEDEGPSERVELALRLGVGEALAHLRAR